MAEVADNNGSEAGAPGKRSRRPAFRAAFALMLAAGISFPAAAASDTHSGSPAAPLWSEDIRPIFARSCVGCHRPGGGGEGSLTTWEEVRPRARAIRESVAARRMPPWHASPGHAKFSNDRSLTPAEIDLITAWADAGAPKGADSPSPLAPPAASDSEWRIGEPDYVFELPEEQIIPADLVDEYRYFYVKHPFTEEMWIEAVEVRPGNTAVVHHLLTSVVGSYEPGVEPLRLPPGIAVRLDPGRPVMLEVHYHNAAGAEQRDLSSVGVRFARTPVRQRLYHDRMSSSEIVIPPGAAGHPVSAEMSFKSDALLYALRPHMHLRGRSARYTAFFPDGTQRVLAEIPAFDFNWQTRYVFSEPVGMPAGARLVLDATYDNSPDNPSNPDPAAEVRYGPATTDEMLNGHADFTLAEEDMTAGRRLPDPYHYGPDRIEELVEVDLTLSRPVEPGGPQP